MLYKREYIENNKKLKEELERLNNGCEELEQQIDDLYKLETTLTNENEKLHSIIKEVREKVMNIKEINEIYKQTDMLERFYSRKWCNDEMDNFLEILDKENKK